LLRSIKRARGRAESAGKITSTPLGAMPRFALDRREARSTRRSPSRRRAAVGHRRRAAPPLGGQRLEGRRPATSGATSQLACVALPPASHAACHAEGRGFESHQPLPRIPCHYWTFGPSSAIRSPAGEGFFSPRDLFMTNTPRPASTRRPHPGCIRAAARAAFRSLPRRPAPADKRPSSRATNSEAGESATMNRTVAAISPPRATSSTGRRPTSSETLPTSSRLAQHPKGVRRVDQGQRQRREVPQLYG
jgi:hypothetical protein